MFRIWFWFALVLLNAGQGVVRSDEPPPMAVRMFMPVIHDVPRRDVQTGTINFVVATSMGIVQHFAARELSDGFSGYKNTHDQLLLIVRRAAEIRQLSDLASKHLVRLAQDELSTVYLETLFMKSGVKPESIRKTAISQEKRSSALVHQLFFAQSDAALIYRNTYEAVLKLRDTVRGRQVLDIDKAD